MAHFAFIDEKNIVRQVIVVDNNVLLDEEGKESEEKGVEFCKNFGTHGRWIQTSYNSKFRGTYAGIGHVYNEQLDIFEPPTTQDPTVGLA